MHPGSMKGCGEQNKLREHGGKQPKCEKQCNDFQDSLHLPHNFLDFGRPFFCVQAFM